MLIDTLKVKTRLVEEFDIPDRHAAGIVEAISSASDEVVTHAQLQQEFQKWTLRIVLANGAIMAVLLALFGFVVSFYLG